MGTTIFYERIKEQAALKHQSLNQVERNLGYSRNALNNYKIAREPSAVRLLELADYFQVSPKYLIGETHSKTSDHITKFFFNLNEQEKIQLINISQEWMINYFRNIQNFKNFSDPF